MSKGRQATGSAGEDIAASRLISLGYQLIERNWRRNRGELDLVMRDGEMMVFVEVKTRHGDAFGAAESGISQQQAAKLLVTAEWYLADHPEFVDAFWRIDLVAITLDRQGHVRRLNHLKDAVQFG